VDRQQTSIQLPKIKGLLKGKMNLIILKGSIDQGTFFLSSDYKAIYKYLEGFCKGII